MLQVGGSLLVSAESPAHGRFDFNLLFVVALRESTPRDKRCSQTNQYQADPEITRHFFLQNQPCRECEKHSVEPFEGIQVAQVEAMQER
jgi:hypothetical protein